METKWIAILCIGITAMMFAPLMISSYQDSMCRIEAIKAGIEADKIKQVCGIK